MASKKRRIAPKRKCCKSDPRCARCPVVLKRLAKQGVATRTDDGRFILSPRATKKVVKAARNR